jgi:hypothetical protein
MILNKKKRIPFKFNFHFDEIDKKNKAFRNKQLKEEERKKKLLKAKEIELKRQFALKNKCVFIKYSLEYLIKSKKIKSKKIKNKKIYNIKKKKVNKNFINYIYIKKKKYIFLKKNKNFHKNYPFLLNINLIKENF